MTYNDKGQKPKVPKAVSRSRRGKLEAFGEGGVVSVEVSKEDKTSLGALVCISGKAARFQAGFLCDAAGPRSFV